ncbi:MAG: isoprenylcysteine carboxyl methyltransferase [Ancylobacter novellus]|uniref:Isoprenylcysteine carboxyl methyltransferase n=1 Tax=Ancylobacter novellus TaxID=921 RepID=A0A2W5K8R4_ANCNO|nr:MAG: isoprenylcysteine carboxyl methyltransferase [Ancylobacter novellus]
MRDVADLPGVKIPPPIIFVGFLALGAALHHGIWPASLGLAAGPRWILAVGSLALGAALIVSSASRFRAADTPPAPWKPTRAIVASGPYRLTRNPMYLGMSAIYVGVACAADSLSTLVLIAPLMAVIDVFVVRREERYLERKFGDEYGRYRSSVRRWL